MTEYSSGYNSSRSSTTTHEFSTPTHLWPFSPPLSQTNPAQRTYQQLIESIYSFEKRLDDEHEVGARLVSFGAAVTFHLQDVSYCSPDIINFSGKTTQGEELHLIQHVSQLSVLLVAMKKLGKEPVRIGFKLQRAVEAEA